MRELTIQDIKKAAGGSSHGEIIAGGAGSFVGGMIGAEFGPVGVRAGQAIGGVIGKELYGSISNGYVTAPGVTQGVGSYNPNYNPGLISSGSSSSWGGTWTNGPGNSASSSS